MDEKKLGRGARRVELKAEEEAGERAPYFDGLDTRTAIIARLRELAAQGKELVGGSGRYQPVEMIEPVEEALQVLSRRKLAWDAPDTEGYLETIVRGKYGVTSANGLCAAVIRAIRRLVAEGGVRPRVEPAAPREPISFSGVHTEAEIIAQLKGMVARGEELSGSKKTYSPQELLRLVSQAFIDHATFDPTQDGAFDRLDQELRTITNTAGLRQAVIQVILNRKGG